MGERWTLRLIRELLAGPKRFTDLLTHLPGMGTNLLAARLKELETGRLLRRATLPPPAAVAVYELTPRGQELEPALLALSAWGRPLLGPRRAGEVFFPSTLLLAMKKAFRPEQAQGLDEAYEYRIAGTIFQVRVEAGTITTRQGVTWPPDLVMTMAEPTLLDLAAGQLAPTVAQGAMQIEGGIQVFYWTFALFGVV